MNRVLLLVAASALSCSAFAQKPDASISTAAFIGTDAPIVPNVIDNHDFEVSEGYATGVLNGQQGWTVFGAAPMVPVVDTSNPSSGAQHLLILNDAGAGAGTLTGGFSPDLGPQPATEVSDVSVDMSISNTGGADYDVVGQAPSTMMLSWRVKFSFLGDIQVLDDTGGGLGFTDTGVDWTPGTYFNLRVVTDPVGNTIDYFIDGALIYSSVGGVVAAAQIEQVVILSDNFQLAGETGDFDNLLIDTAVVPDADLTLTVTDTSMQPVNIGDQFDFVLTAGNNGPGAATNVAVTSTLSANVDYVSDTCGSAVTGNMVTWTIGALASGGSVVCNLTVQVNGFGSANNSAVIAGDQNDPTPANNTAGGVVRGPVQSIPTLSFYGLLILSAAFLLLARRRSQLMN